MFTGIVEGMGIVADRIGARLSISAPAWPLAIGDSVSVSGVCLTVVSMKDESERRLLGFDVSEETGKKTTMGALRPGDRVNLERAVRMGDALGGHIVQGHVDTTTEILTVERLPDSALYTFAVPSGWDGHLVPRGSIALDGISLTIADIEKDRFRVAVIPHTEAVTTLGGKKAGDKVNVEIDVLAKHVERLLSAWRERGVR